jgi:dihydrofolate reductase
MMITIIAAVSDDGVIGAMGSGLLWRIPEDMEHFKQLTIPHPVIMGRVTYETIPAKFRPLKDRLNVVVTRDAHYEVPPGVLVCLSIEEAIRQAALHDPTVYIAGGGTIYEQALDQADALEITEVHQRFGGNIFFPTIDQETVWKEVSRESHEGPIDFSFVRYERR